MDTSDDKRVQGWSNYETWAVNLWLSNDEAMYRQMFQMTEESEGYADELADRAGDWAQDLLLSECRSGVAGDLITAATERVDWEEIAAHWIREHYEGEVTA